MPAFQGASNINFHGGTFNNTERDMITHNNNGSVTNINSGNTTISRTVGSYNTHNITDNSTNTTTYGSVSGNNNGVNYNQGPPSRGSYTDQRYKQRRRLQSTDCMEDMDSDEEDDNMGFNEHSSRGSSSRHRGYQSEQSRTPKYRPPQQHSQYAEQMSGGYEPQGHPAPAFYPQTTGQTQWPGTPYSMAPPSYQHPSQNWPQSPPAGSYHTGPSTNQHPQSYPPSAAQSPPPMPTSASFSPPPSNYGPSYGEHPLAQHYPQSTFQSPTSPPFSPIPSHYPSPSQQKEPAYYPQPAHPHSTTPSSDTRGNMPYRSNNPFRQNQGQ
ncbi:hypothetical protein BDQ17DRAFT_1365148 [Cyathus striatus]|nr:hypothetical protein BDQ17DRAFT_1365148 [Cyathus striatus]